MPQSTFFAWRDSVKQLKRNEDFSSLVGLFLQSVGFPFDIQGPGSSRNVLLHFLHNKATEDGNQTCSPPFLLGLVGRMTYLDLTFKHLAGILDGYC